MLRPRNKCYLRNPIVARISRAINAELMSILFYTAVDIRTHIQSSKKTTILDEVT